MCNPAAFTALQAVGTFVGQDQNAAAANKQAKKNFEKTTELVGRQTIQKQHANQQERIQIAARVSQEIDEISTEAEQAFALSRISAGEGGVAGSGVLQVLQDFKAQEAKLALTSIRNEEFAESAGEAELDSIQLTAESTLANALPQETPGGNFLQLALSLGGATVGGIADSTANQLDAGILPKNVKLSFNDIFLKGPTDF